VSGVAIESFNVMALTEALDKIEEITITIFPPAILEWSLGLSSETTTAQ
jgi:hypothetical protein